jgi:hypothetical protein
MNSSLSAETKYKPCEAGQPVSSNNLGQQLSPSAPRTQPTIKQKNPRIPRSVLPINEVATSEKVVSNTMTKFD